MKKNIVCENGTIEYELIRKKVKNINLRIHCDGSVVISAPARVKEGYIERFIRKNSGKIIAAVFKMRESSRDSEFFDGMEIYLFGEAVQVFFDSAVGCKDSFSDKRLVLNVRSNETRDKKKALEMWLRTQLEEKILSYSKSAYEDFGAFVSEFPSIVIKEYKSRWGSCQPSSGRVTFNLLLAAKPLGAIEYVVYHEFCHYAQMNHSKRFYDQLEKALPDWKKKKAMLKSQA